MLQNRHRHLKCDFIKTDAIETEGDTSLALCS